MRCPERRRGVTLLELMVALAITGLSLVAGRLLLETINDSGRTISAFARQSDTAANADRVLRSLLGRAEVSADSLRRFRGDSLSVSFDSWCDRPAGWIERCRVGLAIGYTVDSSVVTALLSSGEVIRLHSMAGVALFRYVTRDTSGTRWLQSWGNSITAPYALSVLTVRDTVVLVIEERG
jgi:prepilin-type N-terminal cleavage/methylation domain-containing protein